MAEINLERLRKQLIDHEGLRNKPYRCTAGKLTIGVGRNLEAVGISTTEALYLLDNDLERLIRQMRAEPWFQAVRDNEVRQRVLIDMAFNMGLAGLKTFKRTLEAVEDGDFELASQMMLQSKWSGQVGKRATRLAAMMLSGQDSTEPTKG